MLTPPTPLAPPAAAGRRTWRRLVAGLAVALLGFSGARADLRVVGTDLLGLDFSRALYAFSGDRGVKLALAFDGSRSGLEALKAGRADLALVVLPPRETAAPAGATSLTLAYHPVWVLAPADCPLEQITLAQLAAVFGAPESGPGLTPMHWSDLGVTGAWSAAAIAPWAPESGGGLTSEYFRHAALRDGAWRANVQRYATAAELAAQFSEGSRAVAIAPGQPAQHPGMKLLRVTVAAARPGVPPSASTLHDGSYPLRLPITAVFSASRQPALAPLLEFMVGEDAARVLEQAGITPLPADARESFRRALE